MYLLYNTNTRHYKGILTSFIKQSVKHCFNGICQAFFLFTMTDSNTLAIFSIMYLTYIDSFSVSDYNLTFGNTRLRSVKNRNGEVKFKAKFLRNYGYLPI